MPGGKPGHPVGTETVAQQKIIGPVPQGSIFQSQVETVDFGLQVFAEQIRGIVHALGHPGN